MNPVLEVLGVGFRYGKREILRDLSLGVPAGSVTALLGRNGAGKSTLLRLALGILRPRAGSIRVDGIDPLRQRRRAAELIGYMPDQADVDEWMTPAELYRFLAPQYRRWDRAAVERLTDAFAIPLSRRFRELSRGESTKAMVVAAVAYQPRLLLLDEPFAGLDPLARRELLAEILSVLPCSSGATLVATHDLDVVARVADRVALLDEGRIVHEGTLAEVLSHGDREPANAPRRLEELFAVATKHGEAA